MKISFKSLFAMTLSITFFLTGCKKEGGGDLAKYFTIPDARVVGTDIPEATSDITIYEVGGLNYALPGGSNTVSVVPSELTTKILVGVDGVKGYYELSDDAFSAMRLKDVGEYTLRFSLIMNTKLNSNFIIKIALVDEEGNVGEVFLIPVSFILANTGVFQLTVSWDKENDVDLYVVEPDGNVIYYNNPGYEDEPGDLPQGFLDIDSNADCEIDGINSENISFLKKSYLQNGVYDVRVNLYDNCEVSGKTYYTAIARVNGKLIAVPGYSNPYNGSFDPGDEYCCPDVEAEAGVSVMKININPSSLPSAKDFGYFEFDYQNSSNPLLRKSKISSKRTK